MTDRLHNLLTAAPPASSHQHQRLQAAESGQRDEYESRIRPLPQGKRKLLQSRKLPAETGRNTDRRVSSFERICIISGFAGTVIRQTAQ